jgi:hypothetical protein
MFAMSDDELLFDEVLNSGLQADLLRMIGVEATLDVLDEDPVARLRTRPRRFGTEAPRRARAQDPGIACGAAIAPTTAA